MRPGVVDDAVHVGRIPDRRRTLCPNRWRPVDRAGASAVR